MLAHMRGAIADERLRFFAPSVCATYEPPCSASVSRSPAGRAGVLPPWAPEAR